eukprot:TRINITY_DN16191_c0_g1_i1.p1 TRINITY_DN16191_c0_g1~~TRINITY_DN16191_c0_g1_i1.p1  ORF type:complete len:367 (+),score=57.05 TRINITY_DN16191_c0_g1_i1:174-1274(+)
MRLTVSQLRVWEAAWMEDSELARLASRAIVDKRLRSRLTTVCSAALRQDRHTLYLMMVREGIAPIDVDSEDLSIWTDFKSQLVKQSDRRVLAHSLKFFRSSELEHLWIDQIDRLLKYADLACADLGLLDSITGILWRNPKTISGWLLCVWKAFLKSEKPSHEDKTRVKAFMDKLNRCHCSSMQLFETWTEHSVINLLKESLHLEPKCWKSATHPTLMFCEEVKVDSEPMIAALRDVPVAQKPLVNNSKTLVEFHKEFERTVVSVFGIEPRARLNISSHVLSLARLSSELRGGMIGILEKLWKKWEMHLLYYGFDVLERLCEKLETLFPYPVGGKSSLNWKDLWIDAYHDYLSRIRPPDRVGVVSYS